MNRLPILFALGLAASATFTACDSAGHDHDEGEAITKVVVTAVAAGGASQTATFDDANRNGLVDGGEVTGLTFNAGQTYTLTTTLFNGSAEVTGELVAERNAHVFVYAPGGGASTRLSVTSGDLDGNGLPFRRIVTVAVNGQTPTTGTLGLQLLHFGSEADKRAASGVPTATTEADVSVVFPVTITAVG